MDDRLKNLEAFERKWLDALNQHSVQVTFKMARLAEPRPDPQTVADDFVSQYGYRRIAPYWRPIESGLSIEFQTDASTVLTEVLSKDLVYPQYPWLTQEDASQCASDFVDSFKPSANRILTNRIGHGWNPIGDWTMEWAFVGFDNAKIALLLLQAED